MNDPDACEVEDFPAATGGNSTVHIRGAFSSSLKRSKSTVTFSLSGFTIPDATQGATPTFVIKTRWSTEFPTDNDTRECKCEVAFYDIDRYEGFSFTVGEPTEKLKMELVGDGIVGQSTSLQIDYVL